MKTVKEIVINRSGSVTYVLAVEEGKFTLSCYRTWADKEPTEIYSGAIALIKGFGGMNYWTALDLLELADKALPKRQARRLRKFYDALQEARNSRQAMLCIAKADIADLAEYGQAGATDMREATTRLARALREMSKAVAAIA